MKPGVNRASLVAADMAGISAGAFGPWLCEMLAALRSNRGMNVPCGDCVGCCTSGYSILLRPHDTALDIAPAKVQSSVRGLHYPHMQMKPLENGHCPMFVAHGCGGHCSIYAQRPQTCLDYDCRIFAVTGMKAGDRPVINQRIRAWRFTFDSDADRQAQSAIRAAAAFIRTHADAFSAGWLPDNPSGMAVLALKTYGLFMDSTAPETDSFALAAAIVEASRKFDGLSASGRPQSSNDA